MRLLSTSVLILLNIASVAANTGKAEPPKFHPDEKPPKFNRDPTDAPARTPTVVPGAPVWVWPPTPAPVRPPPPTRPPTPSPTPPPTKSPIPAPVFIPVGVPIVAPVGAPTLPPNNRDTPPGDIVVVPTTTPPPSGSTLSGVRQPTLSPTRDDRDAPPGDAIVFPQPTPAPIMDGVRQPTPRPTTRPPTPSPTLPPTRPPTPPPTPPPTLPPTPPPTPPPTLPPTPPPTPPPTTPGPTLLRNIFDLAADTGNFDTLLGHIGNTPGVLPSLITNMPITIFGPTDAAFADGATGGLDTAALGAVIGGHAVPGVYTTQDIIDAGCIEMFSLANTPLRIRYMNGVISINDARVTTDDVTGPGGNILGVGSVILPGSFRPCRNGYVEQAFENGIPDPFKVSEGTLYEAADRNGDYGILLAAITRSTGVMAAIEEHFPVTIFGPNDAAYTQMYEMLATTDIPDVGRMFSGHVVSGAITLQKMVEAGCMELFSLAGTRIRVWVRDRMVYVNDALMVAPDMAGDGGVIHGIDKLLMPDSFSPCPRPVLAGNAGDGISTNSNILYGSAEIDYEQQPAEEQEADDEDDEKDDKKKNDNIRRLGEPSDLM